MFTAHWHQQCMSQCFLQGIFYSPFDFWKWHFSGPGSTQEAWRRSYLRAIINRKSTKQSTNDNTGQFNLKMDQSFRLSIQIWPQNKDTETILDIRRSKIVLPGLSELRVLPTFYWNFSLRIQHAFTALPHGKKRNKKTFSGKKSPLEKRISAQPTNRFKSERKLTLLHESKTIKLKKLCH